MGNILDVRETAKRLGYHPDHIYRLIKAGKIKATRFGKSWMITIPEIERVKSLQDEYGRLTKNPD